MNKRPTGISILAVLYLLGSLVLLAFQLILADPLSSAVEPLGVSNLYAMVAIGFLGVFGIVAAVGMWTGKKWGWWLGALYLFYSVFRNANTLWIIPDIVREFGEPEGGVTRYYIKHGGRIIVGSLLILYFFKFNVVKYFQVDGVGPWKRFFLLIVMTIGIVAVLVIAKLYTTNGG